MAPTIVTIVLRALQFLWTLLIIALTGDMIAGATGGNPAIVNFTMFVVVFGMLSLIYLIPASLKESFNVPIATVGLDGFNTVLYAIAGIALAAELDVHSCTDVDYTRSNPVTNGSANTQKRCHEAQAVCAFLWFAFATFAASTVFSFFQSRGSVNMRGVGIGGIRRGGPSMSQV